MNTHAASYRRYRPKIVKVGGAQLRQPIAVRFPWMRPGAPELERWNVDDYAQRSFMDGQEQFVFANQNTASTGLKPGDGEPRYTTDPDPSRKAQARLILTTKNSKRDVVEARFPIVHPNEKTGNIDTWWTHFSAPIGRDSLDVIEVCPSPMNDSAIWIRKTGNRIEHTGPLSGVGGPEYGKYRLPEIAIYTDPTPIDGGYIEWDLLTVTGDYRFDIKRRCTRVFCYKDCVHVDGVLTIPDEYAILREIDPETSGLLQNDIRFQPFGWTDAERITGISPQSLFGTTADGMIAWPLATEQDETKEHVPPPQESGPFSRTNSFSTTAEPGSAYLLAGLKHAAQPWSVAADTANGFDKIQEGRPFDLIVVGDIYRYKLYKYDETTGTCLPVGEDDILPPVGDAGMFGVAYAIF